MSIFKSYLKILKKNSIGIIIYLVIFMAISIMFSFSDSNDEKSDKQTNVSIAVINKSEDDFGKNLKEYLGENYKIVEIKEDDDIITESLLTSYVDYVLKINKDNSMQKYSVDAKDYLINSKIYEYVQIKEIMEKFEYNPKGKIREILSKNLELKHYKKNEKEFNVVESMYYYNNSLLFVMLAIIIIGLYYSEILLQGSRVLVSSMNIKEINKKLILSSLVYVFSIWIMFMALFVAQFGFKNINTVAGYGYILSSFVYLVPASGLGFFIASVSKSREVNLALQNTVTMLLAFISNVFIPFELLPSILKKIAIISPMYWNNLILKSILEGRFFEKDTLIHIFIQILIGITFILLSVVTRKNKSKNELA